MPDCCRAAEYQSTNFASRNDIKDDMRTSMDAQGHHEAETNRHALAVWHYDLTLLWRLFSFSQF